MLLLLWSLIGVSSQIFPYVSFMGEALPNHAFVNFSLVGDTENNSVICHTDLSTCCSGPHHGDWYFPNGEMLNFTGNIRENRSAQQVELRSLGGDGVSGVYRCDIATNASSSSESVYVGLYSSGGRPHRWSTGVWSGCDRTDLV